MMRLHCDADRTTSVRQPLERGLKHALLATIRPVLRAIEADCQSATWEDALNTYFEVTLPPRLREGLDIDISIQDGRIFIRQGRDDPAA